MDKETAELREVGAFASPFHRSSPPLLRVSIAYRDSSFLSLLFISLFFFVSLGRLFSCFSLSPRAARREGYLCAWPLLSFSGFIFLGRRLCGVGGAYAGRAVYWCAEGVRTCA
ncbi:hypothetical protein C8J57DRAFT_1275570 [Mycena rebaudengoi]|nr:hypothetical protein C8J57DRAFT_1275570 [Mycena rebaudengoi]